MIRRYRRPVVVLAATLLIAIAAVAGLAVEGSHHATAQQLIAAKLASKDLRLESQGTANGGQGGESAELLAAMQQFDNARVAPGNAVAPGGYSAAYGNLQSLGTYRRLVERADRASRTTPTIRTTATSTPTRAAARARHRPHHRARRGQQRRRLRRRRRRRRLAVDDGRRQLDADRGLAPVALLRRPRARARRLPLVRDGRGEHRRHELRRHRRLPSGEPDHRHVLADRPRRRQRARVDDDQLDPVHLDRRVGRDAPRRLLAPARQLLDRHGPRGCSRTRATCRAARTPASRTRRT